MLYALRKLIAIVFLGGIVWFVYKDLDYLDQPWFMHALGILAIVFAVFWLIVPLLVVKLRIRQRLEQNTKRYEDWLAEHGSSTPQPIEQRSGRIRYEPGELLYFHEKGTLYVPSGTEFEKASARGRPGDVAFPYLAGVNRKIQRVHCLFTDRRLIFCGKTLERSFAYSDVHKTTVAPGGLVFTVAGGVRLAFTFQNPLVAADILKGIRSC